jgi:peptide deformylase
MILPVYLYGHPILRKQTHEIPLDYPDLDILIENMFETMYHDKGVGLAAPQVGKSIRLFVIDSHLLKEDYPDNIPLKEVFINPVIEKESGNDFVFSEGCLSIPSIHADVVRSSHITVSYIDGNKKKQYLEFKGITARIIQHEYDHLEGKVFVDRLPSLKRMVLKRKLNDIVNGKEKPNYKFIL